MAIQYINTGTGNNSGNGDSIRTAFTKVNQNIAEIVSTLTAISNLSFNPVITNLTVTNNLRVIGNIYLGTQTSFLSVDPITGDLKYNLSPLLGDYRFYLNNLIPPKNAIIATTSTFEYKPTILLDENDTSGTTTSTLSINGGLAYIDLKTEVSDSTGTWTTLILGSSDYRDDYLYFAGLLSSSINGQYPNYQIIVANTGSVFTVSTTSERCSDFQTALIAINSNTTGVLVNSQGVWINGATNGVTIANNTSTSWEFRYNGDLKFPDGSIQSTAVGVSDRLTSGTSTLLLKSNGSLILDQQGVYDGSNIDGTLLRIDTDQPNYTQVTIQNYNTGSTATSDLMFVRDDGDVSAATGLLDIGINSSNYSEIPFGVHTPGSAYMFSADADLIIGTQNSGKRLVFHAGGTTTLDSAGYVDDFSWRFNRDVQITFGTPGPLNFTVQNTLNNSAATAVYQAVNNIGDFLQMGIMSSNAGAYDGAIGPRETYLHAHTTASLHIGNTGDLIFWSDEANNGFNGTTATLVMSRVDRSSTFGGHVLPAEDLAYDLGSSSTQWRSLHVGTGTIYIGGVPITVNQTNNTLIVGAAPGTEPTTSTNLATESYVIDYVNQFGGSGLEIDGGFASTDYTAEIIVDGGEA